jgi:endonuclease G
MRRIFFVLFLFASLNIFSQTSNIGQRRQYFGDDRNFVVFWVPEYRISSLVYYTLTREQLQKNNSQIKRPTRFSRDTTAINCPEHGDYTNSGFDRGHQAPDGDYSSSVSALIITYFLTNVTPQYPIFNQRTWVKLENYARDLAMAYNEVKIITGPIIGEYPQYMIRSERQNTEKNIETGIVIPVGFFKVFLYTDESGKKVQEAYLLPHINENFDFRNYVSSIEEVMIKGQFKL